MGNFSRDSKRPSGGFSGGKSFGGGSKFGGRDGGKPEMHQATCSECNKECQVPFRPNGSRPIFCSDCFSKQGGGSDRPMRSNFSRPSFDGGLKFGGRDGGRATMHQATCAKCGDNCEVPFQPTPGKPVFCSNCFEKGGGGPGRTSGQTSEQMEMINRKLDLIMKNLGISDSFKSKKDDKKEERHEEKHEDKKVKEKKAEKVEEVKEKKVKKTKVVAKKAVKAKKK
jgi:CxxC-x17-CxxC domain-containing protein